MIRCISSAICFAAAFGIVAPAYGTFILSPVTASASGFSSNTFSATNTINQSGLSSGFVSGVTDYGTYVATNPTHASSSLSVNFYFGGSPPFGQLDYDLGVVYTIDKLAFWGGPFGASMKDFDLIASNVSDFSVSSNLGSFSATTGTGLQEFSFTSTGARYIRIDVMSNNGGPVDTALGEVAFSAIPEPTSLILFGTVIGILGIGRRRT